MMCLLWIIVVHSVILAYTLGQVERESKFNEILDGSYNPDGRDNSDDFYKHLLHDLRKQRFYDSIFLMQQSAFKDARIQGLYKLNMPKIIGKLNETATIYIRKFNSEILAILIMEHKLDVALFEAFAHTLDYMRQTRILIVALNFADFEKEQQLLLSLFEKYKMTNVLIHLSNTTDVIDEWYFHLKPYPKYHLEMRKIGAGGGVIYFPKYSRNMHRKTVYTLPDQILQHSVVVRDHLGQLKFSGIAARLALLFAEHYNASLELLHPVQPGDTVHVAYFANLTMQGRINLPMSLFTGFVLDHWLRMTYPVVFGKWLMMIPCPKQFLVKDIYTIIVPMELLASILASIAVFSLMHSLIDYVFDGRLYFLNLIVNDRVIVGVLGQPFAEKVSSSKALKIVYLLIILLGLIINTLFAAHLKTLITAPPLEQEIKTFDDLMHSKVRIMFDTHDVNARNKGLLDQLGRSILYTSDSRMYQDRRKALNTANGYTLATGLWEVFKSYQLFFSQNKFCIPPGLTAYDNMFLAVILEEHSPLREPLNELIHQAHAMGLPGFWRLSSFLDMLKYNVVPPLEMPPPETLRILTTDDLQWTWSILAFGLATSAVCCLSEMMLNYVLKK